MHCHVSADEAYEEVARTAVKDTSPWQCRARRVRALKNGTEGHLGLAVEYWITGNEPAGERVGNMKSEVE